MQELATAARRICGLGVRRVVVEGHTDSIGGASDNIGLSQIGAATEVRFRNHGQIVGSDVAGIVDPDQATNSDNSTHYRANPKLLNLISGAIV